MELFKILLLSIVEGISEWLPISSTGHMLLVEQVLPLHLRAEFKEIFFVVIQFFAILSVLFYFFRGMRFVLFLERLSLAVGVDRFAKDHNALDESPDA